MRFVYNVIDEDYNKFRKEWRNSLLQITNLATTRSKNIEYFISQDYQETLKISAEIYSPWCGLAIIEKSSAWATIWQC